MKLFPALGALALVLLPVQLPQGMSEIRAAPVLGDATQLLRGTVSPRTTLAALLDKSISRAEVHALVEAARPVYNLARISSGRPFALALGPDGLVSVFSYGIDELKTLRVRRVGEALRAEILERRFDTRIQTITGSVRSSLFGAVMAAGEEDQLALDLAEIFAWDIDFNTELQRGDSFRVAVEKLWLDGRLVRYGRILGAEFQRGEKTLRAVRFEASRGAGYYAPDGTPLRKQFLRSPLRFDRVSSGYSAARFHPILQRFTTHFGIDFAAPTGTPVNAAADGVVAAAGVMEGFGNAVKLRHPNGIETLYGHLSRIGARPGQRVTQGTPIGAVGQTGLATGPHLHYAMFRGGQYANPMKVQSAPAEPIPDDERTAFLRASASAVRLIEAVAAPPRATDPRKSLQARLQRGR